jgi:hypothetical protein
MPITLKPAVMLSRLLIGPRRPRVFPETLTLLLSATGCSRGAAYIVQGDALELVDQAGMTADLQRSIRRLSSFGLSWFTVQRAARTRTLVMDRDIAFWCGGHLNPAVLAAAGWGRAAACPIVSDGALKAVIALAVPSNEEISQDVIALLEIGCNFVGLHLDQRIDAPPLPKEQATAPTEIARSALMAPAPIEPMESSHSSGTRERELSTVARRLAEGLRGKGPLQGSRVLDTLQRWGLSQAEAFSVITFSLSTGILVRDEMNRLLPAPEAEATLSLSSSCDEPLADPSITASRAWRAPLR